MSLFHTISLELSFELSFNYVITIKFISDSLLTIILKASSLFVEMFKWKPISLILIKKCDKKLLVSKIQVVKLIDHADA